jgi:CheY-like chemotaxis protein
MLSSSVVTPTDSVVLGPYILLVDDHAPTLRRLHELVKLAGHRCVPVGSATSALRTCEVGRPRVVVTDLAMPNLDGRDLARRLKDRYPSVPIILVTGEPLDLTDLGDLRGTFTAVFPKPIEIESFLNCLEQLMPSQLQ